MEKKVQVVKIFGIVLGILFTFLSFLAPKKWAPIYLSIPKEATSSLTDWALTYSGFTWQAPAQRIPSFVVEIQNPEVKKGTEISTSAKAAARNPASADQDSSFMKSMEVMLKVGQDYVSIVSIKTVQLGGIETKTPTVLSDTEAPEGKESGFLFTFMNSSSQIVHQEYHSSPFTGDNPGSGESVDTSIVSLDYENHAFQLLFNLPSELNIDSVEVTSQSANESHSIGRANFGSL